MFARRKPKKKTPKIEAHSYAMLELEIDMQTSTEILSTPFLFNALPRYRSVLYPYWLVPDLLKADVEEVQQGPPLDASRHGRSLESSLSTSARPSAHDGSSGASAVL